MFRSKILGIDVGTSAVKLVELSEWRGRVKVENYGQIKTSALYEEPFRTVESGAFLLSMEDISKAINAILEEANIGTSRANFSIPDFSTFSTSLTLPPMGRGELNEAVRFEARQHVPLPLSELTLDWNIVEGRPNQTRLKVLVVAIPDRIVNQYKDVAGRSDLELDSLEAEGFSMTRALSKTVQKKKVVMLDLGARTTTINIVDQGTLRLTHSIDISGNDFTQNISKSLQVDREQAEYFKKKYGVKPEGKAIRKVLLPRLNLLVTEIQKITRRYQREGGEMEQVVIGGGTALMPGLEDYLSEELGLETNIIHPFSDLYYPSILEERVEKLGPSFAVAIGLALRPF